MQIGRAGRFTMNMFVPGLPALLNCATRSLHVPVARFPVTAKLLKYRTCSDLGRWNWPGSKHKSKRKTKCKASKMQASDDNHGANVRFEVCCPFQCS